MASITEALPFALSTGRAGGAATFAASGFTPDISVAEMPFFMAISNEQPYVRQTADARRQQIDTSREPGEQTLSQWWVRDQDSWHHGAGINFYEPGSDTKTQYRFSSAYGINPWVQGEITLHKKMDQLLSSVGNCYVVGGVVSGVDTLFVNVNGSLKRIDGSTTTYTGTATPATEPVIAGSKVLVGTTAGIIAGDTTGSTYTTLWTTASGVVPRPFWAKSRIIAAKGPDLYDLTLAGGNIDTQTPLWSHPSANFTWTSVAEAPGAILAAGYVSGYGYIYRFTLNTPTSGSTPVLGPGVQVAEFPPGEEVHAMRVYLATYVAIGTAKGIRVALVDTDGTMQYGPIIVPTTLPVKSFSARDTYIYAAIAQDINGNSGAVRIDLSEAITNLRFPWAYDVQVATTNVPLSITFLGLTDRVVLGITGLGIYQQNATQYEASGIITSGWIRYSTAEPKVFNRIKIRALTPSTSTVSISTIDNNGGTQSVFAIGAGFNTDQDITLQTIADVPQAKARISLTLTAGAGQTTTPTVQSYQVKATPVPTIQREIKIPLRLNDHEQDRQGVKVAGYEGYAYDRLVALEAIENDRSVVVIKDYTTDEAFSAQIKSVQFVRQTPPARGQKNFGGIVYLTVLKL